MLASENRLQKRKEFNYIHKNGNYSTSKYLTLLWTNTPKRVLKIGFSVSKKIGKAVVRNKIKRQLRAIVRELIPYIDNNIAYIFVARNGIENIDFIEIKQTVISVLEKSKKLKGSYFDR